MNKEIEALKELHSDKIKSIDLLDKANNVLGPSAMGLSSAAAIAINRPEAVLLFGAAVVASVVNTIRLDKLTKRADSQFRKVREALGKTATQIGE